MNEELAMQHSVQSQLQPQKQKSPWPKRILLTIAVLLLVGGIGYGTAYVWRQYTDVKNSLASEKSKNQDLRTQNTLLQKQIDDASATPEISDTLPNGKKITYPDTPGNRNIIWWSAGDSSSDSVVISHKAYQLYMHETDAALLANVCGAEESTKAVRSDISYGNWNTTTKAVVAPQNQNCLDAMASTQNTDATSRAAAQKVLDGIKTDIDTFITSATIQ